MKIFIIKMRIDLNRGLLLTKKGEACYLRELPYDIRHNPANSIAYDLLKQLNLLKIS